MIMFVSRQHAGQAGRRALGSQGDWEAWIPVQAWLLLAVWCWSSHFRELYFSHLPGGPDSACFTEVACPFFLLIESL